MTEPSRAALTTRGRDGALTAPYAPLTRPLALNGRYFPNQVELNTHNKYFLFSDSYERAATIGFRCVVDA